MVLVQNKAQRSQLVRAKGEHGTHQVDLLDEAVVEAKEVETPKPRVQSVSSG